MIHERFMQRAVQLAQNGRYTVAPNPMVGCVVVHQGRIVGEGWHRKAGEPHAEVLALQAVPPEIALGECHLYVSLEPCAHHGRTPPCADLIVSKGLGRVIVGTRDPNPAVDGGGIAKIKAAGIEVIEGVLEAECRELNAIFNTVQKLKRPFITLKWAETSDGFIDFAGREMGEPNVISGRYSKLQVHALRAQHQAILIGANTAKNDQPALTERWILQAQPLPIILLGNQKLPPLSEDLKADPKPVVFGRKAPMDDVVFVEWPTHDLNLVMQWCLENHIHSILVEGGSQVLQSFIDADLWDRAIRIVADKNYTSGTRAPRLERQLENRDQWGGDWVEHYTRTA